MAFNPEKRIFIPKREIPPKKDDPSKRQQLPAIKPEQLSPEKKR